MAGSFCSGEAKILKANADKSEEEMFMIPEFPLSVHISSSHLFETEIFCLRFENCRSAVGPDNLCVRSVFQLIGMQEDLGRGLNNRAESSYISLTHHTNHPGSKQSPPQTI